MRNALAYPAPCFSFRVRQRNIRMPHSQETSEKFSEKKNLPALTPKNLLAKNVRYLALFLKKKVFRPYLKGLCIRMICFYQKHISRGTCLYTPTCSEYTKRSINNLGVIPGILCGLWRILRCNPLSKGGFDPAPERFCKKKWLI